MKGTARQGEQRERADSREQGGVGGDGVAGCSWHADSALERYIASRVRSAQ